MIDSKTHGWVIKLGDSLTLDREITKNYRVGDLDMVHLADNVCHEDCGSRRCED